MSSRWIIAAVLAVVSGMVLAQNQGWVGGGEIYVSEDIKTARGVGTRSLGTPEWTNPPAFSKDVFTFARVRYDKNPYGPRGRGVGGWTTDLPDSDLNLSFRAQQMASIRVDPDGRLLHLTDPELANYPFLFLSAPGALGLSDEEAAALRKHLLNGGFLLMDDFWGDLEWQNCEKMMKLVFPDRQFFELEMDHPVYHVVFEIKTKAQCANSGLGKQHQFDPEKRTWEPNHPGDVRTVHHRGIADERGRLMVLALHNTDTGDGWEREGEDDYYFHTLGSPGTELEFAL